MVQVRSSALSVMEILGVTALIGSVACTWAASVADYTVQVSARVGSEPPQIVLSWPTDLRASGYTIYRKACDTASWGTPITNLAATANGYLDSNVRIGDVYEYRIDKAAAGYSGYGYLWAGIEVPLVESRGKVILLVDETLSQSLSRELARLQQDLVADGWTVLRHDVPRMVVDAADVSSNVWVARREEVAQVKAVITNEYRANPEAVKAVFLCGHLPVPYSGNIQPDTHPNHQGAWPADAYYGDVDGTWTDQRVETTSASDPRNRNVPGDGKFDQNTIPSEVKLQVGRVDFARLPSLPLSETELLRLYLNKNHNFRRHSITAEPRALIDDHLGVQLFEAIAANGWRVFAPFFEASNCIPSSTWFGTLASQSYLWGFACGGGTYTSCGGVGQTTEFATENPRVVFTMFFGSYFGDWDSPDNFLRASLGTPGYTLTSVWAGRPFWLFHPMGLGETTGFSARLTQNNTGLYSAGLYDHYVHVALMGDPTLTLYPVAPPSALTVTTNEAGGMELQWSASPDAAVVGYRVYSAASAAGPFSPLIPDLVAGTACSVAPVNSNVFMVRAVKREVTGSGSFTNASQGIIQSLDPGVARPTVELLQPFSGSSYDAPATIQLEASTCDYGNAITKVLFYANGVKLAEADTAPFCFTWSGVPMGTNVLTAQAIYGGGQTSDVSVPVTVTIRGEYPPPLSLTSIAVRNDGTIQVLGTGIPEWLYQIQFTDSLSPPQWRTLTTVTANLSGIYECIDRLASPNRFYRSADP